MPGRRWGGEDRNQNANAWHSDSFSVASWCQFWPSFSPKISNSRGEKKPRWFEPTSTLCHLYSVTLLSKEIKHFLHTAEFTKEKQASPFTSRLNSTLMNLLQTSPFIILILLRSHRESPSPLQSWNHHGSWGKSLQVKRTLGKRSQPQHWKRKEDLGIFHKSEGNVKASPMVYTKQSNEFHSWGRHRLGGLGERPFYPLSYPRESQLCLWLLRNQRKEATTDAPNT